MASVRLDVVSDGQIDTAELIEFYRQHDTPAPLSSEKIERMVASSVCFVTARDGGRLIGIARGITDGVRGYLVECKLDPAYQGPAAVTRVEGRVEHDDRGIARSMATRVLEALRAQGVEQIEVLAYGTEIDFCEELGFRRSGGLTPLRLIPEPAAAGAGGAS